MADATKKIDEFLPVSDLTDGDVGLGLRGGTVDLTLDLVAVIMNKIIQNAETKKYGIAASVASNALTISLKKSDGTTDPGTGKDSLWFRFRSSTLASGAVNFRQVAAGLSIIISSGSTLGHFAAKDEFIYVYLLDNAGVPELAISSSKIWDEGQLQTTTAEGGAGAADSKTVLYSTTARSNVPIRFLGRIKIQEATPGTWATAPTEIATEFGTKAIRSSVTLDTPNGHGSTNNKIRRYTNSSVVGSAMSYADSATLGMTVTIKEDGLYAMDVLDFRAGGGLDTGATLNSTQLTTAISSVTTADILMITTQLSGGVISTVSSAPIRLKVGDIVRVHDTGLADSVSALARFRITQIGY